MLNDEIKVEDKIFGRVVGKILSETIIVDGNKISFDLKSGEDVHRFTISDKISTKLFSLHGLSSQVVYKETQGVVKDVEDILKNAVVAYNRNVVVLVDELIKPVSIVSEQHKQLPLSKAQEIVEKVAGDNGAKFVNRESFKGSYKFNYEIQSDSNMSVRVSAYLGRNDAIGKAGIYFQGSGHIFVCSNMIVPHLDKDVTTKSNGLMATKIVHTVNVEERLLSSLQKSFECAKSNANVLAKSFDASKTISMSRDLQMHCIELIRLKQNLPDTWVWQIKRQLREEVESLYGLSQALTWVGTHRAERESTIAQKLQKIGGQIVLLGKDFVRLMETSLTKKGFIVPELKV